MAEAKYSAERDLNEAQAIADHLTPYVYEDQLYGNIGGVFGSGRQPSVTIGGLLLRLHRLHALESRLNDAQKARLTEIEARSEQVRQEWTVHYNEKLLSEASSRLSVIEAFFADCEDDPRSCAANYPPEAMRRTIVQVIIETLERLNLPLANLDKGTRKIDSQLRRFTQPADFIWAAELQAAFPKDPYWWLYAAPPRTTDKQ